METGQMMDHTGIEHMNRVLRLNSLRHKQQAWVVADSSWNPLTSAAYC